MTANDQYSIERIADRMQIQDVIYRWCRAIDRLDLDAIRTAFHPDATDDHCNYKGGVDGLIEWIRERHKKIPFSTHQLGNMLIEFVDRDLALVETCMWVVQRYPTEARASMLQLTGGKGGGSDNGVDMMTSARYVDRFERRNGEWKIARRTVVMGWKTVYDVPKDPPVFPSHWVQGTRNADDFVFQERRALGLT